MEFLTTHCFICINKIKELEDLNKITDLDGIKLLEKLWYCVEETKKIPLDVPKFICNHCCTQVKLSYIFKTICSRNQNVVQSFVSQLRSSKTNETNLRETNECREHFNPVFIKTETAINDYLVDENVCNSEDDVFHENVLLDTYVEDIAEKRRDFTGNIDARFCGFRTDIRTGSGEVDGMKPKRQRKTLSLTEKLEIITDLKRGVAVKRLAIKYGVGSSTICNIRKKEVAIQRFVNTCVNGLGDRKTLRKSGYPLMEADLYSWFIKQHCDYKLISHKTLAKKAKELFAKHYGCDKFVASPGWIQNFKYRHGLKQQNTWKKKLSSNEDTTDSFIEIEEHKIKVD